MIGDATGCPLMAWDMSIIEVTVAKCLKVKYTGGTMYIYNAT